jgi:putative acetyltransferase
LSDTFFSPAALTGHPDLRIAALAPMAVAQEYRRQGVGSALIRSGMEYCKETGFGAAVVLGHPEYYPRFGFTPANQFNLRCEYTVPVEAFMVVELQPGCLHYRSGTIRYHEAFNGL